LEYFGTPENVYKAGKIDYAALDGIKRQDIEQLMSKDLANAGKILSSCEAKGCRIITVNDTVYPERLRNIYDPPLLFYIKGELPHIDDLPVVGVVGTRDCTPYGIKNAEKAGYDLSQSGIIVVTGLAKGIDSAAVKGALQGGSAVIGVIGTGLDIIYPSENRLLFEDIINNGAIISEYPPGTAAFKSNFPSRNRIISGLSLGVAVIEAPAKSGALITAARALEQGRDVFTMPGNVDAASCKGSNALLREGAIPFINAEDIIDEYIELYPDKIKAIRNAKQKSIDNTSKVDYIDLGHKYKELETDEKIVFDSISGKQLQVDEIIITTGFTAQKVLASLTILELGGMVRRDLDGKWSL